MMPDIQYTLHPHAYAAPARQTDGAAGHDLYAAHGVDGNAVPICLWPGERTIIPTGISLGLPPGVCGWITPRSGLAAKHSVTVLNAPGLIDSDYRGEIKVILAHVGDKSLDEVRINRGDRIAQLVIQHIADVSLSAVESLPETERGDGGFGSTGQ
jgi:dUTP pyrophosphatase